MASESYIDGPGGIPLITKAANELLDYQFKWVDWLAACGDTIASYTISPDAGITVASTSSTLTQVQAFVSGGTVGTTYKITCKITCAATSPARVAERSILVQIVAK